MSDPGTTVEASLRVLAIDTEAGREAFGALLQRGDLSVDEQVHRGAGEIVEAVRTGGDTALLDAVRSYDGYELAADASVATLRLDLAHDGEEVSLAPELQRAIDRSIRAVERFYRPQVPHSFRSDIGGVRLEERAFGYRRVGLYVPGGRFPYPSTVIMSAVPARLAGAEQIVMVTPPLAYRQSAAMRYACARLGIDEVWGMGGAHAVAALAYGTESVERVDFIAGPGNAWVTAAKRAVSGVVGIDKEAGPSEVVIVAGDEAPPAWVASDLLAQAEHDPNASAVLVTPQAEFAERVAAEVASQIASLPTRETAEQSLAALGCALVVDDWEGALEVAERIAPEHLQLMGAGAEALEDRIRCAGAVFVGSATPTAFGDYLAGPSHVLPTGGAARSSSGLGVEDFTRRQHHAAFDSAAAREAGLLAAAFAREEGLEAHARAADARADAPVGSGEQDASLSPVRFVRPELQALHEYSLHQVPFTHKLDQNEVPWDLPRRLKDEALRRLSERNWAHYPDFHGERLRELLAQRHGWQHDGVLVGNGSNELLGVILDAIVGPGTEVIFALPTFGLYEMFVRRAGGTVCALPPREDLQIPFEELRAEIERDPTRPVILCTPNNPTGSALTVEQVEELASRIDAPLLLDNAYGEFSQHDYRPLLRRHRHLVLLRTFSKAWSLAGLRLGYLLADPELVTELIKIKLPYNVNHAAAVIGEVVLERPAWGERSTRLIVALRDRWQEMLESHGLEVFPSEGNFLLVRATPAARMDEVRLQLAERGILVRKMSHYPGLDGCARFAVGSKRALRATDAVLTELLATSPEDA